MRVLPAFLTPQLCFQGQGIRRSDNSHERSLARVGAGPLSAGQVFSRPLLAFACRRVEGAPESDSLFCMRSVEIYLNETIGSMFIAWTEQAELRCAWRGELELPLDDEAALDVIWQQFNADQRPAGYQDRSLSVADVITLDGSKSWAVNALGFRSIPLLSGAEIQTFDEWSETHPERKQLPEWMSLD